MASPGVYLPSQFLTLVDTHSSSDCRVNPTTESSVYVPFFFRVPGLPQEYECAGSTRITDFPPSLTIHERHQHDEYLRLQGSIRYTVEAYLYTEDGHIDSCANEIRISNCSEEIPPPLALDDFPSEYKCTASGRLRRRKKKPWLNPHHSSSGKDEMLAIAVPEPPVVCLDRAQDLGRPLPIALSVTFTQSRLPRELQSWQAKPESLEVTLDWSLTATTFISIVPMHEIPTRERALLSPFIASSAKVIHYSSTKFVVDGWRQGGQHCCNSDPVNPASAALLQWKGPELVADETLHLALPGGIDCSPTFFTPHISRRYSVRLVFESKLCKAPETRLELKVPVQLIRTRSGTMDWQAEVSQILERQVDGRTDLGGEGLCSPLYTR